MKGLYRTLNMETLQSEADNIAKKNKEGGGRGKDVDWLSTETGWALYVYILPPFSERGAIGREVFKCYKIPDDKVKTHVSWRTYDIFEPGIGERDPVVNALRGVEKLAGDKINRMWPSRRVYLNVIANGKKQLDDSGNPVGPFIPFETPGPYVLDLSSGTYDQLITRMSAPGLKPIVYPEHAVLVEICRFEAKGRVNYSLKLMGNEDETGFTPRYDDLFEKYGKEQVEAIFGGMTNLDKMWVKADEEAIATANRIANTIRIKFGASDGSMPGAPGPGGTMSPFAAPGAPFAPPAAQPAPAAAAPPAAQPAQPVAPPPAAAPAAAPAPAVTPAADTTEDLSAVLASPPVSDTAPKNGDRPVCFKNFPKVQASAHDHKQWCAAPNPCTFKMLCEMSSPKR
jgi:hypothetical protein